MSKRNNDFYPTPEDLALAITRRLSGVLPRPRAVLEPSAGTGAHVLAAKEAWPGVHVYAIEVDPGMRHHLVRAGADQVVTGDWLEVIRGESGIDALILGNPPFSLAQEHIVAGMAALAPGCHQAMLLRMGFMGTVKRIQFWRDYPARWLIPLVPRPSFTGEGNDYSEYGVFVWEKGYSGLTEILPTLVWK